MHPLSSMACLLPGTGATACICRYADATRPTAGKASYKGSTQTLLDTLLCQEEHCSRHDRTRVISSPPPPAHLVRSVCWPCRCGSLQRWGHGTWSRHQTHQHRTCSSSSSSNSSSSNGFKARTKTDQHMMSGWVPVGHALVRSACHHVQLCVPCVAHGHHQILVFQTGLEKPLCTFFISIISCTLLNGTIVFMLRTL